MKTAIIIPVHNSARTIEATVESVFTAFGSVACEDDFFIFIVESGSTDDGETDRVCEELLSRHKSSISYSHSAVGVSNARIKGISEVTEDFDYITFLDADDQFSQEAFRVFYSELIGFSRKEAVPSDIIMGAYSRVYEGSGREEPYLYKDSLTFFDRSVRTGNTVDIRQFENDVLRPETGTGFMWGKFFRQDFLVGKNILPDPELSMAEDAEFMVRASREAARIAYVPAPFYQYFFNPNSVVRAYRPGFPDEYLKSIAKIRSGLEARGENLDGAYNTFVLYHLLLTAVNFSFNPADNKKAAEEKAAFKELVKNRYYAEALKKPDYSAFSRSRRIVLFFIVHRMYGLVRLAVRYRQRQFRRWG